MTVHSPSKQSKDTSSRMCAFPVRTLTSEIPTVVRGSPILPHLDAALTRNGGVRLGAELPGVNAVVLSGGFDPLQGVVDLVAQFGVVLRDPDPVELDPDPLAGKHSEGGVALRVTGEDLVVFRPAGDGSLHYGLNGSSF